MRLLSAVLVLLIATSACLGETKQSESKPATDTSSAYSRRNFKLGMTLSEFRRTVWLDQKEHPGAFPACSNDPGTSDYADIQFLATAFTELGIIKCAHFWKTSLVGREQVLRAGLHLGNVNSLTDFYFWKPTNSKEPVLFWIQSGGPTGEVAGVVRSFTIALGPASETKRITWISQGGVKLPSAVHYWRNNASQIEIKEIGATIRIFEVNHTLTSVWNIVNRRLGGSDADNAKRL